VVERFGTDDYDDEVVVSDQEKFGCFGRRGN
jgi:hypothetical protein